MTPKALETELGDRAHDCAAKRAASGGKSFAVRPLTRETLIAAAAEAQRGIEDNPKSKFACDAGAQRKLAAGHLRKKRRRNTAD